MWLGLFWIASRRVWAWDICLWSGCWATIVKWYKHSGQPFKAGEPLYEIETEKVNQEVAATSDGTMIEIIACEGEIVK